MVNKIKASLELTSLIFVLSCLIIGIGFYTITEIKVINNKSKELYNNQLIPMDQLSDVRYNASLISATFHQAKENQIILSEPFTKIKAAHDKINLNWANYLKTDLTAEEIEIINQVKPLLQKISLAITDLELAQIQTDKTKLSQLHVNNLLKDLKVLEAKVSVLLDLQVKIGQKNYLSNIEVYKGHLKIFYSTLFIVLVLTLPFSYYIIRKNSRIIKNFNLGRTKLHLTEENYRNLIEYAGEAILILNEKTEIVDVNELACKLFGYQRSELIGLSTSKLIAPNDFNNHRDDITNVKKNKIAIINRKMMRKDGSLIEVEITKRIMEDKGFFSIVRDISERKKNEMLIKESEAKYRYLFNNSPAFIIIWDLETLKILEINDTVLQKYGYSPEEWKTMTVLDYRPKEEYDKIKEFAQFMLHSDQPIAKRYWRHFKKNGEEMLMEIASHKILYNDRKAILSLANDVTEKVTAENKLIEREAQLNLFIENSPVALAMFDKEMRYIATSKQWKLDYNLIGKDVNNQIHYDIFPNVSKEWREVHQRCMLGAIEKSEEDFFITDDGKVEWLKWEVHPWYKASNEIGGIIIFTEIITERKRATERFKNQFENSPDTILYINKFYKIEAINRGTPDGRSKDDLVGLDCISILPEEARTLVKDTLDICFKTGEKQEIENLLTYGRYGRSRMVPLQTNGIVTHILIFATDITERKKVEEQIIRSEEKYRALTENISDAIILINEKLKITFHSPTAEKISKYSFEEVESREIAEFVYPEDYDIAKEFLEIVLNSPNEPINNQFRIIDKLGNIIWVEGTAINLLDNNNIQSIIINYRDITDRKQLEEQQAFMASIVNTSDDAILSESLDGIITSWNKGAEKLLQYNPEETIGNHISMLIPKMLKGEEERILSQIKIGNSVDHYETQRMKKNEEVIYVSLTISPIKDYSGRIIGASKIMRDISDRKKFENDLIHYNQELQKANSELDRFVYSASHDLRAPLKSMLGLIDITENELNEADECEKDVLIHRFQMLNRSVTKLDNFIEDILNYSRNARLELEYEAIDFKNLIQEIHANFAYSNANKTIELIVQDDMKTQVATDAKRLTVILNNIMSNAYKYCDVTKEKSFLKFTLAGDSENINIKIEDNGVGIPASELDKIFDMFYRATVLSNGSGLGLYIVKETLQKLKGSIKVTSEENQGTTFDIEIPNMINSLSTQ
jgi:PAS domain S-box-containing protein